MHVMSSSSLKQSNIDYHKEEYQKHGKSILSLGWGSKVSQEIRFEVIKDMGILTGDSILDVGCGFGDFANYMLSKNINFYHYEGVDINSDFIKACKEKYRNNKNISFNNCDLDDLFTKPPLERYDWVVASGIFSFDCFSWKRDTIETVKKMFLLCKKGISVNFLSARTMIHKKGFKYVDPDYVIKNILCNISNKFILRHDYKVNDFTIYIYKDISNVNDDTSA